MYYIWKFDRVMWDWNMAAKNIAIRRIYVYAVKCLQCNFIFSMKLSMLLRWLFVTKSTVHLETFNRIQYTYVDFCYCCRLYSCYCYCCCSFFSFFIYFVHFISVNNIGWGTHAYLIFSLLKLTNNAKYIYTLLRYTMYASVIQ